MNSIDFPWIKYVWLGTGSLHIATPDFMDGTRSKSTPLFQSNGEFLCGSATMEKKSLYQTYKRTYYTPQEVDELIKGGMKLPKCRKCHEILREMANLLKDD